MNKRIIVAIVVLVVVVLGVVVVMSAPNTFQNILRMHGMR